MYFSHNVPVKLSKKRIWSPKREPVSCASSVTVLFLKLTHIHQTHIIFGCMHLLETLPSLTGTLLPKLPQYLCGVPKIARSRRQKCANPEKTLNVDFCIQPSGICARELGTTSFECWFIQLTYFLAISRNLSRLDFTPPIPRTPCAVWHHSRPHRRLWTIPAVLDIYIPRSPRKATQMCCPKSRLRSPAISSELDAISPAELAGDCGRSQSRPRTAHLSG